MDSTLEGIEDAEAISTTVYVVGFEPDDRAWIESALGRSVDAVIHLDDVQALLESEPFATGRCLIASADVDAPATLNLVRALRARGSALPVVSAAGVSIRGGESALLRFPARRKERP